MFHTKPFVALKEILDSFCTPIYSSLNPKKMSIDFSNASIDDLPKEILHYILYYAADSTKNLIIITSTCKNFRDIINHPSSFIWRETPLPHWISPDSKTPIRSLIVSYDLKTLLECQDTQDVTNPETDVCGIVYFSEKSARDVWIVLNILVKIIYDVVLEFSPENNTLVMFGLDQLRICIFSFTTKVFSSMAEKMKVTVDIRELIRAWENMDRKKIVIKNTLMIIHNVNSDNTQMDHSVMFVNRELPIFKCPKSTCGYISLESRKILMKTLWCDSVILSYSEGKLHIISTQKDNSRQEIEIPILNPNSSWKDSKIIISPIHIRYMFDVCFAITKKHTEESNIEFGFEDNSYLSISTHNKNSELVCCVMNFSCTKK
jgi:hypothetical protein